MTGVVGPESSERSGEPPHPVELQPGTRLPAWLPALCTFGVVAGVIAVTLWQLHPSLLLSNTTTTGGDTGSHYIMPAYLRNHLLGSGRLTGWDPGWYDGYPIYTFYFLLPDALTAVASYVIPYAIAFKLATVLGSLLMPVGAWACGKLFGLRSPYPAALAAATLPFLFDYTFTIYGGNLFSTLAGEYAYSLAIPLALVFLGLFARGLRTGRGRGWAALVLALTILAHIVPAALALVGAALLVVLELMGGVIRDDGGLLETERRGRWRALWWGSSTVGLGVALSAWWLVPFLLDNSYATQMGYQNVDFFTTLLFPHADLWAVIGAGAAVLVALWTRSRFGILFSALGGLSALGLVVDPQGALYNVRLLPLWFLCVYLMVGWLTAAIVRQLVLMWRSRRAWVDSFESPPIVRRYRWGPAAVAGPIVMLLGALVVVVPPFVVPASALPTPPGANQVSAWATWNYTGYEGKASYPEFRALMRTMTRVGHRDGCGRAMWEYNSDENRFGTPEALMDLPYFTGGCIDSMEGLVFESSATTPYHFLDQAELSPQPSNPMVGLPYSPVVDVPLGIQHLQLLGTKYFIAYSPQVVGEALKDPALRLLTKTGPWPSASGGQLVSTTWDVFEVRDSTTVVGLRDLPAVERGISNGQPSWLKPAVAWYDHPARWGVELAASGPSNWPRVAIGARPPKVAVRPARVTDIVEGNDTISFHVDRVGSPVLVKTSYFPNWVASGANGPWRVTPNLMVVVPTSRDVTLSYGLGTAGKLGYAIAGAAVLVMVGWFVVGRWRRPRRRAARSGGVVS